MQSGERVEKVVIADNSMFPLLAEGDVCFVSDVLDPLSGDLVCVRYQDALFVKRFRSSGNWRESPVVRLEDRENSWDLPRREIELVGRIVKSERYHFK